MNGDSPKPKVLKVPFHVTYTVSFTDHVSTETLCQLSHHTSLEPTHPNKGPKTPSSFHFLPHKHGRRRKPSVEWHCKVRPEIPTIPSKLKNRLRLHCSEEYSDLTIKCGHSSFKVHRAIVCPSSGFFAAACRKGFLVSLPFLWVNRADGVLSDTMSLHAISSPSR